MAATAGRFAQYLAAAARNPVLLSGRKQYLFVLSHMRCHTSLLSHVLGSHPEINGHSEMHQGYSSSLDLLKLRCKVSMDNAHMLKGRYVLDKVLFDYGLSPRILTARETKVIFVLRKPESTLKSIMAMAREYGGVDWHHDPHKVLAYYVARLCQLEEFAILRARAGAPTAFYFDSELLIDRTDLVLRELTHWLGLASDLSPRYRLFETTGRSGWGDPSEAIRSGRILKSTVRRVDVDLDGYLLEQATPVFDRCRNTFLALCRSPPLEDRSGRLSSA
jgi:hypothetical protein